MGGVDRHTLDEGEPDEVRRQVAAAIEATGGLGLILAPGCSVSPTAPEANLRAMWG
jgi:uroporphyrinogen-III decarboxylase